MTKYKFLPHTADIKFQAFGKTIEECFENAFLSLKEVMIDNTKIEKLIKKKINIKGKDLENLLYNFLEEFLFLLDAEQFVPSKIINMEINMNNYELQAEVEGDNSSDYKISNPVKAITYNDMFVKKEKNKYVCQVVVDV